MIVLVESKDELEAKILNEIQLSGLYSVMYNFEGENEFIDIDDIIAIHNRKLVATTVHL